MSETKQPNWLPWVLVAGLAYFAFMRQPVQPVNPDDSKTQPVASVSKILDAAYKADRSDKLKTLKEFADMQFPSDQEALKWFNDTSTQRRIETFIRWTDRVGKAMSDGKVKELAAELEAGR
jgi:hypothetical protein